MPHTLPADPTAIRVSKPGTCCHTDRVPERETVAGELVALLTTERASLKVPVAVGAKVTLKVEVWPAARVSGRESPLRLKVVPAKLACETVTLAVPELVKVTVCELLGPTVMLPKLRLAGLTLSWEEEGTVTCTSFE
jgi:hypothetical protein